MPKITYIEHDGTEHVVEASEGISVIQRITGICNNTIVYEHISVTDTQLPDIIKKGTA